MFSSFGSIWSHETVTSHGERSLVVGTVNKVNKFQQTTVTVELFLNSCLGPREPQALLSTALCPLLSNISSL